MTQLAIVRIACLMSLVLAIPAAAQHDPCDPSLLGPRDDPYRYQLRGDRCEGIYAQEVSSTTLWIGSLTDWFEDYDLNAGTPLHITWAPASRDTVWLRANALERRRYYRMDIARSPGATSDSWPAGILSALTISRPNLGLLGWTRMSVGATSQLVYLPLDISQRQPPRSSTRYQVVLVPGRELSEVYVHLAPVESDGRLGPFLRHGEPLRYGQYPAERSIAISIDHPSRPGIYYLEIGADLAGGGAATTHLFFFNADADRRGSKPTR